jgi:hypothetical protein
MSATATPPVIAAWHRFLAEPEAGTLRALLAEEVEFCSPAVHKPQVGRELTFHYLWAAVAVLGPSLTYVHEWYDENSAVLRFTATLDGRDVEGVDLIQWDETGHITAFTVMARPLRGLQALITAMGAQLQAQQ